MLQEPRNLTGFTRITKLKKRLHQRTYIVMYVRAVEIIVYTMVVKTVCETVQILIRSGMNMTMIMKSSGMSMKNSRIGTMQ